MLSPSLSLNFPILQLVGQRSDHSFSDLNAKRELRFLQSRKEKVKCPYVHFQKITNERRCYETAEKNKQYFSLVYLDGRRPSGRNECVANKPQSTSAGRRIRQIQKQNLPFIVHLKKLFPTCPATAQDQEDYFKSVEFLNNCNKSLHIYN